MVRGTLIPTDRRVNTVKLQILRLFKMSLLIQALCIGSPLLTPAQRTGSSSHQDYQLKVDVNLTSVLATVTTADGALVANLKQEDFQVFENDQLQTIAVFDREMDQPLRLSLLFDSSVSILTEIKVEQEAAIEFFREILRAVDRVSVFQISEDVQELVRNENRTEKIAAAIRSIKARGGTSLYDAIYLAAEGMAKASGRKVVLIVSDGTDTTSQLELKDCLKMCQNSEALVYALVVQPIKSEPGRNLAGEHAMIYLAEKTGGRFFKVISPESYRSTFATIGNELRTQYYLAYYSKQKTVKEEFRTIEIKVRNPAYIVRHRAGFYTTR